MTTQRRFSLLAVAVISLSTLTAGVRPALASVPDPGHSTAPACFVGSPDGAFVATVIVKDIAGSPINMSNVVLDFSFLNTCTAFSPCPTVCTGCTLNPLARTISNYTDAAGVATFDLRLGGVCPNETFRIYADGVLIGTPFFSSLDQDGDQAVTGADLVRVQNAMVTGDRSSDFDCSGTVTAADLAIANAHLGHTCSGVVAVPNRSWGFVKGAYR